MGLFKRHKKNSGIITEDNITEKQDISIENVDFSKLSKDERSRYVEEQCEIILECNNNIESAKKEYKTVSWYFADIQLLDNLEPALRDRIAFLAKSISDLAVDRKMLFTGEKKLSGARYMQMRQEEDDIVDAIKNLKNNELYLQIVKRDMNSLTGEKAALRIESDEYLTRQKIIKNTTIVSLICFAIIFIALLFLGDVTGNDSTMYFLLTLFAAVLFAAGDIFLYQRTISGIMLNEKKINRAIVLHNKVKIKYINTYNLIQYQYDKYGVKSSYELADLYQRYLETKAAREKYRQTTQELGADEEELEGILSGLSMYDYRIWMSQVKALCDPKEMVEIRHDYSVRRQGLRNLIEENSDRAENAKLLLRNMIKDYPEFAGEVLQIVDKYDS